MLDVIAGAAGPVLHKGVAPVDVRFVADPADADAGAVPLKLDAFVQDGCQYVLVKALARLWNFPSAYQVIAVLVRRAGIPKAALRKTDAALNRALLEKGLISEADSRYSLYYVPVNPILARLQDRSVLVHDADQPQSPVMVVNPVIDDDKITVGQIFPQYGYVDSSIDMSHAFFNSLTNLSKFNYYKATNHAKFLGPTKLFPSELDLVYNNNDHSKVDLAEDPSQADAPKRRKPLGKGRKSNVHIDPNNLDLTESVLPGQGYIQEFNINHVCKIPNYYITSNQQHQISTLGSSSSSVNSSALNLTKKGTDSGKMSRNVQQLTISDHDTLNVSKYFYFKTYRGPGSGNYKDAALVNRINKIPSEAKRLITNLHKRNVQPKYQRANAHLKGFVHEKFNKPYIDYVLNVQRKHVEDYDNIEMLHNTLQFNLLTNTYRDISERTWVNYFKFKTVDFDQLIMSKVDTSRNVLYNRFSLPTDYPEIMRHLPVDFREDKDHHSLIKRPLYYNVQYPDANNPQLLTNVEIIKLPNANEIAWDNIKKYKSV